MKTLQSSYSIPFTHKLLLGIAVAGLSTAASRGGTLLGTDISDNVSPTFATGDGLLTVEGYSDTNLTTAANLRTAGDYFGVEAGGSFKLDDSLKLSLAPNTGLTGMGFRWTRTDIMIEGFLSDPGFSSSSSFITNSTYANGVLSFTMNWDNGGGAMFSLSNPSASAGQSLEFWVNDPDQTGWQATITQVSYSPVPEPSVGLLSLAGGLGLWLFIGRRKSPALPRVQ